MKKLNKKGFTLIELLAVIVIMGILMMVAIPAMTRYMENSRKDTFMDTAKEYANSVKSMWFADSLSCTSGGATYPSSTVPAGDYYVPIKSASPIVNLMESGGKSSWGNRDVVGFVRINVTQSGGKTSTKFYVALSDGTHGISEDTSKTVEAENLVRGNVGVSGIAQKDVSSGTAYQRCVEQ